MCLAIPAEIVELKANDVAKVMLGGVYKEVQVNLIEEPKVGDYVIIHAGFALNRLDPDEAHKTLKLFDELFSIQDGVVGVK